jgi:hypothetical protein
MVKNRHHGKQGNLGTLGRGTCRQAGGATNEKREIGRIENAGGAGPPGGLAVAPIMQTDSVGFRGGVCLEFHACRIPQIGPVVHLPR